MVREVAVTEVPARRPGRNEPCYCGSGKKYKHCHLAQDEEAEREEFERRAEEARAAAEAAAEAAADAEPEPARRTVPPHRPAEQPWRRTGQMGPGAHRIRGPRKVGGS
jgi:SEC-C motif